VKLAMILLTLFLSIPAYANNQSKDIDINETTLPPAKESSEDDVIANEDFLNFLLLWEDISEYQQEKVELLDAIMDNQLPINEVENEK
jgi:hypothetical protein